MKLDEKTTLSDLQALIGKRGRYRTALGWSQISTIEAIELSSDGIAVVLTEGKSKLRHSRPLVRFELIDENQIAERKQMKLKDIADRREILKTRKELKKQREEEKAEKEKPAPPPVQDVELGD